MSAGRVGELHGVALAPGVSKNGRRYTAETIGRMVARAQARLKNPKGRPLTVLSHHGAGDDSLRIVGRVSKIWQDSDGAARFEADLADTSAGRDVLALTAGEAPFLRNVSIRGAWVGDVRHETFAGQSVETADDLELDGVDLTKSPGVTAAVIDKAVRLSEAVSHGTRHLVFEGVTEPRAFIDTQSKPLAEMSVDELRSHLAETLTPARKAPGEPAEISERFDSLLDDDERAGLGRLVERAFAPKPARSPFWR